MRPSALALFVLVSGTVLAQQSASFRNSEHVLNAGGRPVGGSGAASGSHRITLDAIGDSVTPGLLAGSTFVIGGGFVTPYPPPGEVHGLRFSDDVTLFWSVEPTTGVYNLYRGALASLSGLAYGSCRVAEVVGTSTIDADAPAKGQGSFYLVTAENLIAEEGTKGWASSGNERPNPAPCP